MIEWNGDGQRYSRLPSPDSELFSSNLLSYHRSILAGKLKCRSCNLDFECSYYRRFTIVRHNLPATTAAGLVSIKEHFERFFRFGPPFFVDAITHFRAFSISLNQTSFF